MLTIDYIEMLMLGYIAGVDVTAIIFAAICVIRKRRLGGQYLILILAWPFTWAGFLLVLIVAITYWFGIKMAEFIEDVID